MQDYQSELETAVKENMDLHPELKPDQSFIYWFLTAFITDDLNAALQAILGGANDKNIDAIFIDDEVKTVYVVQGKYRKNTSKSESRSDLMAFAQVGDLLHGSTKAFNTVLDNADSSMQHLLQTARKAVKNRNYQLALQYVTTGKVSENHEDEIRDYASDNPRTTVQVFDKQAIHRLMQDYIDGAAPPIPKIKLSVEGGEAFDSFDKDTNVTSWVFSMKGNELGQLFTNYGVRVFARNIRGFMGKKTSINESLASTVKSNPGLFWYFNNGATIICDSAKQIKDKGAMYLDVSNAQIINGQQTTRTLAELPESKNVKVLIRVIVVSRSKDSDFAHYNQLVSEIVKATNSQNAIKPADLISNDAEQIRIEREFKKLDHYYARKAMSKSEMREHYGARNRQIIKRDDLVLAIASCTIDPAIVRKGKQQFFVAPYYEKIFDGRKIKEYLYMFWLYSYTKYMYKGRGPEVGYSRHLVNYTLYKDIKKILKRSACTDNFISIIKRRKYDDISPLESMTEIIIKESMKCYKKNKGYIAIDKNGKQRKSSYAEMDYFKRAQLLNEWDEFWEAFTKISISEKYYKHKKKLEELLIDYE